MVKPAQQNACGSAVVCPYFATGKTATESWSWHVWAPFVFKMAAWLVGRVTGYSASSGSSLPKLFSSKRGRK